MTICLREPYLICVEHKAKVEAKTGLQSKCETRAAVTKILRSTSTRTSASTHRPLQLPNFSNFDFHYDLSLIKPVRASEGALLLVCTYGQRNCRCGEHGGALFYALRRELAVRRQNSKWASRRRAVAWRSLATLLCLSGFPSRKLVLLL